MKFLGIAAAIAVVAVVVLVATGGGGSKSKASTNGNLSLTAGQFQVLTIKQGTDVNLTVSSDKADEIHLHGYDIHMDVKANSSVVFKFKANLTGIFEIELENAKQRLGQLKVEP